MSDPHTISFSLHPADYNAYTALCNGHNTGARDKTAELVLRWIEEETGRGRKKKHVLQHGNAFRILLEKWPENRFTMRAAADALAVDAGAIRYALYGLIRDMLVEETTPVLVGGRSCRAFKLTTEGLLWVAEERERLSMIPRRDVSRSEARAAAKLYLMTAGKTGAEAEKILEQEEELCHIQDVPPNYTVENMARYLEPVTL